MFDEITLGVITTSKNKNGESVETEKKITVSAVPQRISREQRDKNNERGPGKNLRFRIDFLGEEYDDQNIPYFYHRGIRYSVRDFDRDKTGTGYFIEGTSIRGKV